MKKLIILTGPQGAGNHLFSKCFASSDKIGGWKELNKHYWQGHHHEPFNEVWQGKRSLTIDDFNGHDYWVTSISIPFVKNGVLEVPNIFNFWNAAISLGVEPRLGLITRDIDILKEQQRRVRGEETIDKFLGYFYEQHLPLHYLSHESLVMHKSKYMNYVCGLYGFPPLDNDKVDAIVGDTNANKKYIKYVDEYWLDNHVKMANKESYDTP
ncbi:MAG: hypothetical protein HOK52_14230 [Candidatus Marinimicrobia bacterium]|jgi:hypothetical protein|nr:hypothetical protein [Candidatus Neomarinimicrobiota bacterium]